MSKFRPPPPDLRMTAYSKTNSLEFSTKTLTAASACSWFKEVTPVCPETSEAVSSPDRNVTLSSPIIVSMVVVEVNVWVLSVKMVTWSRVLRVAFPSML